MPVTGPGAVDAWWGAGVVTAMRRAGLDVRSSRRDTRSGPGVAVIVASNPRCPSWGTVVIGPATLARWRDRWAPAGDETGIAAAAPVAARAGEGGRELPHNGR
jgi:hypothetical protein